MKRDIPILEGEERVFTWEDIAALFSRNKKKLGRLFCWSALAIFFYLLLQPVEYRIEASFQQGAEQKDGGVNFKELLLQQVTGPQMPTAVLMQSRRVLEPLSRHLGLQAEVPSRSSKIVGAFRRVGHNVLSFLGKKVQDPDPFSFEDVAFFEEEPLSCSLSFLDQERYLLEGTEYRVGERASWKGASFVLRRVPQKVVLQKGYRLTFQPLEKVVERLRGKIQIEKDKKNDALYKLQIRHKDRKLGALLLNGVMEFYERYLKEEHDRVALAQEGYLRKRHADIFAHMESLLCQGKGSLSSHIESQGFSSPTASLESMSQMYQQLVSQMVALDVELSRIRQMEQNPLQSIPADSSPFSNHLLSLHRQRALWEEERDFLELALQEKGEMLSHPKEEMERHLAEIRCRVAQTKQHLVEKLEGEEFWALGDGIGQETQHAYLENSLRLLLVQEKILEERVLYGGNSQNPFLGISLESAKSSLQQYVSQLEGVEKRVAQIEAMQKEMEDPEFSPATLHSHLVDPFSQQLLQQINALEWKLRDGKNHLSKEDERWKEELLFQRNLLTGHLLHLLKMEGAQKSLLEEKITQLQKVSLDALCRSLFFQEEQILSALRDREEALVQEKGVLQGKMDEMREKASEEFPEIWGQEQWWKLQADMGAKMASSLTELVESKTLAHNLYAVESKPLDKALAPFLPVAPRLFGVPLLGAFALVFVRFFALLVTSLLHGFPPSLSKLRAMRWPVLGSLSSRMDREENLEGDDLERVRSMVLFLQEHQHKKVALLFGSGANFAQGLANNLLLRSKKTLVISLDFAEKYGPKHDVGLLQWYNNTSLSFPILEKKGIFYLHSGGYSPHGLEIWNSPKVQDALREKEGEFDYILCCYKGDLTTPFAMDILSWADSAFVTLQKERLESLTRYIEWGYRAERERLQFLICEVGT